MKVFNNSKPKNICKTKGFTLIELAIVMVLVGIIMTITVKWMPSLLREFENSRRTSEFKSVAGSGFNRLLSKSKSGFLPNNTRFSPYPQLEDFTDSKNNPWGYLPAYDTTESAGKGVCNRLMQGSITLRYCLDKSCTNYVDQADIALVLFSNRREFFSAVMYGSYGVDTLNAELYKSSPLILYLKTRSEKQGRGIEDRANSMGLYDNYIIAYPYSEIRDMLDCQNIESIIPVNADLPSAYVGEPYSYSGMNFAGTDGVVYCFTQSQPIAGLTVNNTPFSDNCDESKRWVEDKNHNNLWILSGTAPNEAGMLYFTGYAKILPDNYTLEKKFALPVSVR